MEWEVIPEESGNKLQQFLKNKLPQTYSARAIKRAIEGNQCRVNGHVEKFASYTLGTGDIVQFEVLEQEKILVQFESKRVLYEDNVLIAYNKPSGIASDDPQLLTIVQRQLPFLKLIHRLDRDTTGILLFAKDAAFLEQMILLFRQRKVHKEYLAIVDGEPSRDSGTIENALGEIRRYQGQVVWGPVAKSKGLYAHTEWECLLRGKKAAFLRCIPTTGRTHQIRVHLSGIGHPILGDHQYGRQFVCAYQPRRCLLHAEKMTFRHPLTEEKLELDAELPADFQEAMEKLFGK